MSNILMCPAGIVVSVDVIDRLIWPKLMSAKQLPK